MTGSRGFFNFRYRPAINSGVNGKTAIFDDRGQVNIVIATEVMRVFPEQAQ
jgi:hypothetical protein